uniref:CBM21 domain-containing protein n=1 Tax=Panagrolaimus sp. JU765 TaxID=591449 RepID=A0AC34QVS9_9BILA
MLSKIQNNTIKNKKYGKNFKKLVCSKNGNFILDVDNDHTSEDEHVETESDESINSYKEKKVRFADDCGGVLENVRILTEPSVSTSQISPSQIDRYSRDSNAFLKMRQAKTKLNKILYEDCSDDDDFDVTKNIIYGKSRSFNQQVNMFEMLDEQKVALDNVLLQNDHCKMMGTIKVKNIVFEKHVFVRCTFDDWKNFSDCLAVYQTSLTSLYDIFGFEIKIPINDNDVNKIEFCVLYNAEGKNYWDSNDGKNYSLTFTKHTTKPTINFLQCHQNNNYVAYECKKSLNQWSQFTNGRDLHANVSYC